MNRILVATRNPDKLREIREILQPGDQLTLIDLSEAGIDESRDEQELESHETFAANALDKARYFAQFCSHPVLADDSGLRVDALNGAPGVRSKRFSGRSDLFGRELDEANNQHLLHRLEGLPPEQRSAHYVCVVAIVWPDGSETLFDGRCDGLILEEPRGSSGFGYDPLFFLPEEGVTFGELEPRRKNEISHRARALRSANEEIRRRMAPPRPVDSQSALG